MVLSAEQQAEQQACEVEGARVIRGGDSQDGFDFALHTFAAKGICDYF
jgi:hypothetical protein